MTQHPIDSLCTRLAQEFKADPRGTKVAGLLADYAKNNDDWANYQAWSSEGYTRNLVHRCGPYELLLLCWEEGQVSPIHDHAGQQCWMAVLDGRLEEVHYEAGDDGLKTGRTASLSKGEVAFIQDDIAWHRIQPLNGKRAVSLHLYANPIDGCRIFCPESGEATSIEMGYHSVRGQLCDGMAPEQVRAEFASTSEV